MNKWLTIGQTPPSILASLPLPPPASVSRMRLGAKNIQEVVAEIFGLYGPKPFCAQQLAAEILLSTPRIREIIRLLNSRYPATPIFPIHHYSSTFKSGRTIFYTVAPDWREILAPEA